MNQYSFMEMNEWPFVVSKTLSGSYFVCGDNPPIQCLKSLIFPKSLEKKIKRQPAPCTFNDKCVFLEFKYTKLAYII